MLQDRAMLIRPSWSRPTAEKKHRVISQTASVLHNVRANRGKYVKRLYMGSVFDKIVAADNKASTYLKFNTRPWLDEGYRVLPTASFFDVTTQIRKFKDERETLVVQFRDQLDEVKEWDRNALGEAFEETDYEPAIIDKFDFDVIFMPIPRAGDFRADGIDRLDLEKIEADTLARIQEQFQSKDLWQRVYDSVSHISERLSTYGQDENGKVVNKFHDTLILNLRELVAVLPVLNIVGDQDLSDMQSRLEQELCSWDPQTLRDDEVTRKDVAAKAEQILADVAGFVS